MSSSRRTGSESGGVKHVRLEVRNSAPRSTFGSRQMFIECLDLNATAVSLSMCVI